jgi:glycosyltransferase involved in cell wall biosynthesis
MSSREPLVSVIIPTFNRAAYLMEAVRSVFAQTYSAWELIVVDDGSTDDTLATLSALAHPKLRLIAHERCHNPARLRNVALRTAQGTYAAFLDSDDLWSPEKLEVQLADLLAHPTARWSYTKVRFIDAQGAELPASLFERWDPYDGDIFEALLLHEAKVACPSVLAERRLLEEVNGFDESMRFCEDYELWLRLSRRAKVRAVPIPLVSVRSHAGSGTQQHRYTGWEYFVRTYERVLGWPVGPEAKARCRRQVAFFLAKLAHADSVSGRHRSAYSRLWSALRRHPSSGAAWHALARVTARAVAPAAALRAYRSLRHRRHATA